MEFRRVLFRSLYRPQPRLPLREGFMKRNETSKFQAPSTREAPSLKQQSHRANLLVLGAWCFSGAWRLVLGAFVCALSVSAFGATNEIAEVLPPCCRPIAGQTNYTDKSLFLLD